MQARGHVGIQNRQDMVGELHHRNGKASFSEVFCHLKTNESGTDHQSAFRLGLIDESIDRQRVFDGAKGKDSVGVDAIDGRHHGSSARR